jgi:hypothetical protein
MFKEKAYTYVYAMGYLDGRRGADPLSYMRVQCMIDLYRDQKDLSIFIYSKDGLISVYDKRYEQGSKAYQLERLLLKQPT